MFQKISLDIFFDFLRFPLWWYSTGFLRVFSGIKNGIRTYNTELAPGLWLRNLFVPMYGQTDFQGKAVSVFMRGCNVIIRAFLLCLVVLFFIFCVLLWLFVPIFCFLMIVSVFIR